MELVLQWRGLHYSSKYTIRAKNDIFTVSSFKKYSDHSAMDCYDEDISEYLISDTVHVDSNTYIFFCLSHFYVFYIFQLT